MHVVYIIRSETLNRFYIGETNDLDLRLQQHLFGFFTTAYTRNAADWTLFLTIPCANRTQARKIEAYIKRMKSAAFIRRLASEPELLKSIIHSIV